MEELLGAADQAEAGVVDQYVDPAGLRQHGRNQHIHRLIVRDVACQHGDIFRTVIDGPATCPEDSETRRARASARARPIPLRIRSRSRFFPNKHSLVLQSLAVLRVVGWLARERGKEGAPTLGAGITTTEYV